MKSLFVTGTDTGVGKTLITTLLALRLRTHGVNVGIMKPFATGCVEHEGELVSEDTLFYENAFGEQWNREQRELCTPIRLVEPLAPFVAARRAKQSSEDYFARARSAFDTLCQLHETVVVEGVGGLLVPIAERQGRILTCRNWVEEWQLPVVIVARRTLGTINHTLLTVEAMREQAEILGLVFCDGAPVASDDVAAHTSPEIIAEMTRLPILGRVPFLTDLSRDTLRHAAEQYLTWPVNNRGR